MDQTGWGSITDSRKEFASQNVQNGSGAHPAYYK